MFHDHVNSRRTAVYLYAISSRWAELLHKLDQQILQKPITLSWNVFNNSLNIYGHTPLFGIRMSYQEIHKPWKTNVYILFVYISVSHLNLPVPDVE